MWKPGDRLTHRFNPDLGPGLVISADRRSLEALFPTSGEILRFAASSDALAPLVLAPGSRARDETTGEEVTVAECLEDGGYRLTDGRETSIRELWPIAEQSSPIDELARGKLGSAVDFKNRLDALRLEERRRAGGLGSFLGGRIELFPHQLYAAERASAASPVRWLLADEVGLGKTVEACLVMNRLIHTGRAERILVVAPATLTVQWLGELWRKYHQVFVLVDEARRKDVDREHGRGFNPFDVYRRAIVALEDLVAERRLAEQAVASGLDLLVVDEAHHLRRPPGHPGEAAYRAVAPIAAASRHVLLLTATPLEEDAHGFFRLLQLLRPEEFPEDEPFEERLGARRPLPACTSATRRADIGGLPPRVGLPVEVDAEGWEPLRRLEEHARSLVRHSRGRHRRRVIERALASPAALEPLLRRGGDEAADRASAELVAAARDLDPRVLWLTGEAHRWRQSRQKTLVFVAHRETLDHLKQAVESRGRVRIGVFHEDLAPVRRDLEVAQFRLPDGPAMLISTECGGEGRNFEFCHRLVLFDMPWSPATVEQRIGRLDRIGRDRPTEIVYFRPPAGFGRALVGLYEKMGLFREPLGGLQRELRHVAREVERTALDPQTRAGVEVGRKAFAAVLAEAREARTRVQEAALHELHRDPYHRSMAHRILDRVPPDLDQLTEELVLRAAARLGLSVREQRGRRTWLIELGGGALVDRLPGVPPDSRFLGTFDRAEAVANESLDYFASGHPLVEGILVELEEGRRGRTALLQVAGDGEASGLLALYRSGPEVRIEAVDGRGRSRPELARRLIEGLAAEDHLPTERAEARRWVRQSSWKRSIERLAAALGGDEKPQAVAAFRIRRRR